MKKLIEKIIIFGETELLTGLHIGGTNSAKNIGGIDKSVIRNPINNEPFIPGSSLKGKMRSLLEQNKGVYGKGVGKKLPHGPAEQGVSADLFGNATNDETQHPSRIIVRDGSLINGEELLQKTEMPYTEGKTEVIIDRVTSAASPRQMERVPAGARFRLELVINVFENDALSRDSLISQTLQCLQLVKDDYLGGSGSRGYGQVAFLVNGIKSRTVSGYYGKNDGKEEDLSPAYASIIDSLKP